jgi:hypothetical protein
MMWPAEWGETSNAVNKGENGRRHAAANPPTETTDLFETAGEYRRQPRAYKWEKITETLC